MIIFKYLILFFVVKSISSQMDDDDAQIIDDMDDQIDDISVVSVLPDAETIVSLPGEEEIIETPVEQVAAVRARQNLAWSDLAQVRRVSVVKPPVVATVARVPSSTTYQANRKAIRVEAVKPAPVSVVARKGAVVSRAQLGLYAQVAPIRPVSVVSRPAVVQAKPYQKPSSITIRPVASKTIRPVAPVKPYGQSSTALPVPQPSEAPYYTTKRSTALPIPQTTKAPSYTTRTTRRSTALPVPQPTEAYPSYPIRSPVAISRRVVKAPLNAAAKRRIAILPDNSAY